MSDISNLSASEKGELMHQVQQQIALANVQELLTVSQLCALCGYLIIVIVCKLK